MKSIIVYASTHHGNTKKLLDAITSKFDVELVNAIDVTSKDLSEYDLIGFASGIYAAKFHKSVINFAADNLPNDKKIFFIMTSAMDKDFSSSMDSALSGKNAQVLGKFSCKGYNTFGPFKLVGGTSKGKPDKEDLKNAIRFYNMIAKKVDDN